MTAAATTARFLSPNWISELVWDSKSDEAGPQATAGVRTREVLKTSQGCHNCNLTVHHPAVCLHDYEEGEVFSAWVRSTGPDIINTSVHMVLWLSEKCGEATHINNGSSPLSRFLLYFAEIITLLVVETNRYYHDHLDKLDERPLPSLT